MVGVMDHLCVEPELGWELKKDLDVGRHNHTMYRLLLELCKRK